MKTLLRLLWLGSLLVFLVSCKEEEKAPDPDLEYLTYTDGEGLVGAGGGKIILDGDGTTFEKIEIDIPAGALDMQENIVIKDITGDLVDQIATDVECIFEFKPDGTEFKTPVKVELTLSGDGEKDPELMQVSLESGYGKKEYSIFNSEERTLGFELNHFSTYLVSTLGNKLSKDKDYRYSLINLPSRSPFSDLSFDELHQHMIGDVDRAFKRWETYTAGFGTTFSGSNDDPDIEVWFYEPGQALLSFGLDVLMNEYNNEVAPYGICLYAIFSGKKLIIINDDYGWICSDILPVRYDNTTLEGVLTHEIGHLMGLKDEYKTKAFSSYDGCKNFLSVMGDWYCQRGPVSIFGYDLNSLKDEYNISNLPYGSATGLSAVSATDPEFCPGETVKDSFQVKVTDEQGRGVENVTVIFYHGDQNPGSMSNTIATTDENGIAMIDEMVATIFNGNYTITAQAWLDPVSVQTDLICPASTPEIKRSLPFNITVIESIGNTMWDVLVNFNSTTSWHANVTFYQDGRTMYDEPSCPGCYLTYGHWTQQGRNIHFDIGLGNDYIFDGTVDGTEMSGTFVYNGETKTWSASKTF